MFTDHRRRVWFQASAHRDQAPLFANDTTLVVVDMCEAFSTAARVLDAVLEQIDLAIAHGWAIVFVESRGKGHTYPQLLQRTSGYGRVDSSACKQGNDGSSEVVLSALDRKFSLHRFRVCGVNTWACVYETVYGLLELVDFSSVELVASACNDSAPGSWQRFIHPHISVLQGFEGVALEI